ncbi:MAG: PilZ domain-containing protein [Nitrospirae bacterium]|nr:PilZ domain-containing protein [Nitrospirota bacterium]
MAGETAGDHNWGAVSFQRRRYPRIDVTLPVEYVSLSDQPGETVARQVVTQNISSGGLLLILTEFFPEASRLKLRIYLPAATSSPPGLVTIESEVRVVWTEVRTGLEQNEYRCGVLFTQIEDRDLEKVRDFIKTQMERCP